MSGGVSGGFNVASNLQYERGILFLEDYEGVDLWEGSGTGSDWADAFVSTDIFSGNKGQKLITKSTTPADGDIVQTERYFPLPISDLVVCRLRWRNSDKTATEFQQLMLHFAEGVREWRCGLRWSINTAKLEYLNDAGGWTEIPGYTQTVIAKSWDILELQVDLGSHEYLLSLLHGIETDLGGVGMYNAAADAQSWAKIELAVEARMAEAAQCYIDGIYIGEFRKF